MFVESVTFNVDSVRLRIQAWFPLAVNNTGTQFHCKKESEAFQRKQQSTCEKITHDAC